MFFHVKDLHIYYIADSEMSTLTIKREGNICNVKAAQFYVIRTFTD
jgi:hypothetical protein